MNLTLINSFRGGILSIIGGRDDDLKGETDFDRCSSIFFSKLYLTCLLYSNRIHFLTYKLS